MEVLEAAYFCRQGGSFCADRLPLSCCCSPRCSLASAGCSECAAIDLHGSLRSGVLLPPGRVILRRSIAVVLLLLAALQLGFRGMQRMRSDIPMWDFASVYASARTWVHGGDPYDMARVADTWRHAGAFANRSVSTWALV